MNRTLASPRVVWSSLAAMTAMAKLSGKFRECLHINFTRIHSHFGFQASPVLACRLLISFDIFKFLQKDLFDISSATYHSNIPRLPISKPKILR